MVCSYCDKNRKIKWKDKCIQCYKRLWKKTEKGQICEKRYLTSYKGKTCKLKAAKKYQNSEAGKQTLNKYHSSKEYLIQSRNKNSRRRAKQNISKLSKYFSEEIKQIYKICPKDKVVDHIIPVTNNNVCGLHVPWNLQYLSKSENSTKHNSFDGTSDNLEWRSRGKSKNI